MTYFEAAGRARAALIQAGLMPETAALDADLLARHAAGWDLATWLLRRAASVDEEFAQRYEELIERRRKREPVAYIRGVQEFWSREFIVTPAVLIPRPETELLVEAANSFLHSRPTARVVDIGTGSGCIAISLAMENRSAAVFGVDVSTAALDVARLNAERLGIADRVTFLHGEYLADAPLPVDLIVANPPYVSERDRDGLAPEVREHEPAIALFGGNDGWREIRGVLRAAATALSDHGQLMMEIGYGQSERLAGEVDEVSGLSLADVRHDLQGIPRLAIVTRSSFESRDSFHS